MELVLDRLTKQYKNKIAVDRFSYTLHPGVYGLLGANGAGKTTLMRMICTVLNPTAGDILLNGHSIDVHRERYCDILGYLPQDFGYYPDFSARDFMLYMASLKGIKNKTAQKRSNELLHLVGLSDVATQKIRSFSGGMKQRLGIAQAVLNDPQILILDEPTAGLDPKERIRFRNLISDLAKDKIILLSTHIVSDIESIADQILMMKKGKLILSGTAQDLTKQANGLAWNLTIPPHELKQYESSYCISNLRHIDSGVELRIVSEEKPALHALSIPASIEDLFLYHFADELEQTSKEKAGGRLL